MWHCYAGAAEGWGCDEWGEGGDRGCLVDGVGVWQFVIFEGCLVEDGRFAEGDVRAEDVEVFCLYFWARGGHGEF